ncbi:MAG: hypothetical protein ABSD56_14555, partial [Bryobacteraceae bacterium]
TTCSTPTPANSTGASGTFQLSIGTSPIVQAVTSASSYAEAVAPALPTVAPYDILSIFGTNFCVSGSTGCLANGANAVLYGQTDPTTLRYLTALSPDPSSAANPRNLSVTFFPHGVSAAGSAIGVAPLLFATNGQINLIAPAALSTHIGTVVDIIVSFGYGTGGTLLQSKPYPVTVVQTDPGVFTVNGDGQGAAAALVAPTYALITTTAPAIARTGANDSDSIMLYVTGLGSPDVTGASGTWSANCITAANYLAAVNGTIPAGSALASNDGLVMQGSLIPSLPPCLSSAKSGKCGKCLGFGVPGRRLGRAQRFRNRGCGVRASDGIERNWEESRGRSRFGWVLGSLAGVVKDGGRHVWQGAKEAGARKG